MLQKYEPVVYCLAKRHSWKAEPRLVEKWEITGAMSNTFYYGC